MSFNIELADRIIAIDTDTAGLLQRFKEYLSSELSNMSIHVDAMDIAFEQEKSIREDILEGLMPRKLSDEYLEFIALQRKIAEKMFDYDTLVFHGSVVAVDGQAYLFTAKSGTGKSTHTALWRRVFGEKAVMINDDKPFLRITENEVIAYGSPWNGKHGLGTNTSAPLKGICLLERGENNSIQRISGKDALFMLLQQSNRPMDKSKMPKYMELLDRLSKNVAFYRMQCNMDPEAAVMSYEAMSGKEFGEAK